MSAASATTAPPEDEVTVTQRRAREAATAERNTFKGGTKKWKKYLFLAVFGFLFLGGVTSDISSWWNERTEKEAKAEKKEKIAEAPQGAKATASSRRRTTEQMPAWDGWETGKPIPVNVWSNEIAIPTGCRTKFPASDVISVQYRYYSRTWKDYVSGTSPNMSHLRLLVKEEGITELPVKITC